MTHAVIGILKGNTLDNVYVHSGGYLSEAGKMLLKNYGTAEMANALIQLGGLSSIGWCPGFSVAYHRDRKEPLNIEHSDVPDGTLMTAFNRLSKQGICRCYIFSDGQWHFFKAPPYFKGELLMEKPMPVSEAMQVEGLDY